MLLFFADVNSSVRLALQMYLQQEPGIYVTGGMASEAEGLPAQVEVSRPDVVLNEVNRLGRPSVNQSNRFPGPAGEQT